MTSAQGIDVSDFQPALAVAAVAGKEFAYCKATEGVSITDPNLAVNWPFLAAWGKVRGCYHEFVPADGAAAQAQYCYQAVTAAGGFKPGDMAAVVASDYSGTTGAEIAAWCEEMRALAGPHVAVLVYSDLSLLPSLPACTSWPLWVAWPNATAPSDAQVAPWKTWVFWQYGTADDTDQDAFNGTAADLAAWIAAYTEGEQMVIPGVPGIWTSILAYAAGNYCVGWGTDYRLYAATYADGKWGAPVAIGNLS